MIHWLHCGAWRSAMMSDAASGKSRRRASMVVRNRPHAMAHLDRFKKAQDSPQSGFVAALDEIRAGAKRGHWIWYVFPQIRGLGTSHLTEVFAIDSADEAIGFLRDPLLRSRLLTITEAVAEQLRRGTPLRALMGSDIDARKLVSSLTLFGFVAGTLSDSEGDEEYKSLAAVSDDVLALAESQGYPRCAYTLGRIRGTR
jgi:uncharacterized protein (DUF1810 family)